MAKIDWVQERLERWAEWVARGGARCGGTLPMFKGMPVDSARPLQGIVLDDTECWKTATSVKALPEPLSTTVSGYYTRGSLATQEALGISRAVLSQRIDRAHRLLASQWVRVGPVDQQLPTGF